MGDGDLKGRDIKQLIGASILGTQHKDRFSKVESVWRKVRVEYPHALQAASRMTVEDAWPSGPRMITSTSGSMMLRLICCQLALSMMHVWSIKMVTCCPR